MNNKQKKITKDKIEELQKSTFLRHVVTDDFGKEYRVISEDSFSTTVNSLLEILRSQQSEIEELREMIKSLLNETKEDE